MRLLVVLIIITILGWLAGAQMMLLKMTLAPFPVPTSFPWLSIGSALLSIAGTLRAFVWIKNRR